MLCIAAEADPIGTLVVNGEPLSVADIARMTGGTVTEVATLLDELDRNGVLSRDRNGTIYNRRMVRDAKRAKIARKNGKLGGNPTLRKDKQNRPLDNPSDKAWVNGGDKPHIPEARARRNNNHSLPLDDLFERFKAAYPRRKGDYEWKTARDRFDREIASGTDPEAIIAGAAAYAEQQRDLGHIGTPYVKQASRFMSARTWEEFPRAPPIHSTDDDWQRRLKYAREHRRWSSTRWGPKPGEPGCLIPAHLIRSDDGKGWEEWGSTA